MRNEINIAEKFPKHLFWDMDAGKLSITRDKAIIIPRALFATTAKTFMHDIKKLEEFYSGKEIIDILKNTKERIGNDVCRWVAKRYKVEPFLRYTL